MARRRADDELIDLLVTVPWWVSLVFAAVVYLVLGFVLPPLFSGNLLLGGLAKGMQPLAPYVALIFAGLAPVAYLKSLHRQRLLDSQTGLDSIRAMSWQQFELLVGEGFRRQKYAVEERGGAAPDGGVDLVLRKDGVTTIVQCKHWQARQIGVSPVRELYGVMRAKKADSALFVTSGTFTSEAKAFAEGKPVGLVDGTGLLELV